MLSKSPVVYIAIAAALAYYGHPFLLSVNNWERLLLVLFFIFALILCFFRVLASVPFLFDLGTPRYVLRTSLLLNSCVAGLCLGLAARAMLPLPGEIPLLQESVVGVGGILREDPRAFNDGRGLGAMELSYALGTGGVRVSAKGKVQVYFPKEAIPRLKDFGRGSEIYVEGRLASGRQGLLFYASGVHIVRPASSLEQMRTNFRSAVLKRFRIDQDGANNAPAWASLASALLLGIRDNLDTDFTTAFKNAGCAHVLALSGMHLAILSSVIFFVFRMMLGMRKASIISAVFVVVYVFLAGEQPSLVRSGIIYLLGTIALLGFLKRDALSLLALAFILQIFIQNESGVSVSFILSYTALIGILITGETIHGLLRGRVPEILSRSLSTSLGAVIATAGVTAYYFGALWPIGVIAGIFVMPLISLFIVLAFVALVLICIIPILFEPISFVLTLVYRLLEFIVSFAGNVPGFRTDNFLPVLIISLVLAALLEFLKSIDNRSRGYIASFEV
ncbi:MAG: ComEC family competence protein [Treponema sp.]|jgi:competence protein ComEC|nr:ComEC family competence protein [Treponema sp.]